MIAMNAETLFIKYEAWEGDASLSRSIYGYLFSLLSILRESICIKVDKIWPYAI
jgi:hypothetical protein